MGQIFVKASMRAKAYTRNTNLSIGGKVLKRNTKLGRQVRKERVIGKLNKGMERADSPNASWLSEQWCTPS